MNLILSGIIENDVLLGLSYLFIGVNEVVGEREIIVDVLNY
jgi:hypothetical protein